MFRYNRSLTFFQIVAFGNCVSFIGVNKPQNFETSFVKFVIIFFVSFLFLWWRRLVVLSEQSETASPSRQNDERGSFTEVP